MPLKERNHVITYQNLADPPPDDITSHIHQGSYGSMKFAFQWHAGSVNVVERACPKPEAQSGIESHKTSLSQVPQQAER